MNQSNFTDNQLILTDSNLESTLFSNFSVLPSPLFPTFLSYFVLFFKLWHYFVLIFQTFLSYFSKINYGHPSYNPGANLNDNMYCYVFYFFLSCSVLVSVFESGEYNSIAYWFIKAAIQQFQTLSLAISLYTNLF